MNILFISGKIGCSTCFNLNRRGVVAIGLLLFGLIPGVALYGGYRLGAGSEPAEGSIEAQLATQRESIAEARLNAEQNLNALALRLGEMQAHVARLNAVGQRLTKMAGLMGGEFDFSKPPAQGGPESQDEPLTIKPADLGEQLDKLSLTLQDRSAQLDVLESLLIARNVQAEFRPTGRPSESGFVSSNYGSRTDPFTGRQSVHKGVDVAGSEGDHVVASAAGVVTFSGERSGYGNMVEIDHGNGLATRYGHNQRNLAKVGETVRRGQVIAHLGSTGRSTGPHVHFEVLRNGQQVNPMTYLAGRAD